MVEFGMRGIMLALGIAGAMACAAPASVLALRQSTESSEIDGLWSGSWGGGAGSDGVVFQPVIAELVVDGDRIEMSGFRNIQRLTGTFRLDADAEQIEITPVPAEIGDPQPTAIRFSYEVKGDEFKLIDGDGWVIELTRLPVANDPLINVQVEFFAAKGIDESGNRLVTPFRELRANQIAKSWYQPLERTLKTKKATVLLVQESGCKKITVEEARTMIKASSPVAVAFRDDERTPLRQFHELWSDAGTPNPDNEAVWQTFSQSMRPGTLVFILNARENGPQP